MHVKLLHKLPKGYFAPSLFFLAIFVVAYFDSIEILLDYWSGVENFSDSYGYLLLASSVYLLYLKREEFQCLTPKPFFWALIPVFLLSVLWLLARLVNIQMVQMSVLPLIPLFAVLGVLGFQYFKLALLPLGILLLAVPIWDPALPYLMDITTVVSKFNLELIGRPVFVQGYYINVPGGSFVIDPGCAGLRFLLVTLALGFIATDMFAIRFRDAFVLMSIGVVLALLANWLRVLIVILIGDFTRMESPFVEDHSNLGWVIYLFVVLIPLLLLIRKFSGPIQPLSEDQKSGHGMSKSGKNIKRLTAYSLTIVVLLVGPLSYAYLHSNDVATRLYTLPTPPTPWQIDPISPATSPTEWQPSFLGASETSQVRYTDSSEEILASIVFYASQSQNAELINANNRIVDEVLWFEFPESQGTETLQTETGPLGLVYLEAGSPGGERRLVKYWYNIGGYDTTNRNLAKVYEVLALFQQRPDARLIAFAIDCDGDCNEKNSILDGFITAYYPALTASIRGE